MPNTNKIACIGKECVACGRCVKECRFYALSIYKGMYAIVEENKCKGCGKCGKACPASVIELKAKEVETA